MPMTTTNGPMRLIALVGVIGIGATAAGCGGSGGHTARPISNVTATTWLAVTNTPTITNSQFRVLHPMLPSGRNFYRLRGS